jgi:hypothetical protein
MMRFGTWRWNEAKDEKGGRGGAFPHYGLKNTNSVYKRIFFSYHYHGNSFNYRYGILILVNFLISYHKMNNNNGGYI